MPTIQDLFRTKVINDGPNTGKTAEQAYAVQNVKSIIDIQTTNPLLQSFANKINKRRKEQSIRLVENRIEEDSVGLKPLTDTAKLILYGGDYFRIINRTTRSKQIMLKSIGASGAGLDDSITDKVANALGSFVGDRISNALQKKGEQVKPPPKIDLKALGTDIGADIVSRTLGTLLPEQMIPSNVVKEFEKGVQKKKELFEHEYDIDKRNKFLNNKNKVPKLIQNLLRDNKDSLGQTKDFLISKAASAAGGLLKKGIGKLSDLVFDGVKKKKAGSQQTIQPSSLLSFKYSSKDKYTSKRGSLASIRNEDAWDRLDLSAFFLQAKLQNFADFNLKGKNLEQIPKIALAGLKDGLNSTKAKYSDNQSIQKEGIYKKRGMTIGADALNTINSVVYSGTEVKIDEEGRTSDNYDFVPLKFYSIYKNETLQFRCTISDMTETYTPNWDTNKFLGSPFNFYTYQSIERSLTFSFKIFSLNLHEHTMMWERINELASYTYPQDYKGIAGAVVPPILKLTIGNWYKERECFIDSLTFSVDENTPWEIGMNKKATSNVIPIFLGGFAYTVDENLSSDNYKLPMIINVEIGVKFLENRFNSSPNKLLYGYVDATPANRKATPIPPEKTVANKA